MILRILDTVHICQLEVDALIITLTKTIIFKWETVFLCGKAPSNQPGNPFKIASTFRAAEAPSNWFNQLKLGALQHHWNGWSTLARELQSTFLAPLFLRVYTLQLPSKLLSWHILHCAYASASDIREQNLRHLQVIKLSNIMRTLYKLYN